MNKYDSDYETKGERREKKKSRLIKRGLTKSDKEGRKMLVSHSKEGREEEALRLIKKQLSIIENRAKNRDEAFKIYRRWVLDSLAASTPLIDRGNLLIERKGSGVKAGGQHMQKTKTSVRITHLPTFISSVNESERVALRNKERAMASLEDKLRTHLNLWKILTEDKKSLRLQDLV